MQGSFRIILNKYSNIVISDLFYYLNNWVNTAALIVTRMFWLTFLRLTPVTLTVYECYDVASASTHSPDIGLRNFFCVSIFCCHFRNTLPEMVISILLAVGVCLLGSILLAHSFCHDFAIFWLCFVIAGCQYSLLKVCSGLLYNWHAHLLSA